jgi:hypothetical protein
MGDGARRLGSPVATLRVAERRTRVRVSDLACVAANPEAGDGVTAVGGGVVGCGGEGGPLLVVFWKNDCKISIR